MQRVIPIPSSAFVPSFQSFPSLATRITFEEYSKQEKERGQQKEKERASKAKKEVTFEDDESGLGVVDSLLSMQCTYCFFKGHRQEKCTVFQRHVENDCTRVVLPLDPLYPLDQPLKTSTTSTTSTTLARRIRMPTWTLTTRQTSKLRNTVHPF